MRVTTAFNTILALSGARVVEVRFTPQGVIAGLRRRGRWMRCPCGLRTRSAYDRSRRRWRHLDLGGCKLYLEAEIRRIRCQRCRRVRTEVVPWARPGERHTRDVEDLVAWLAQRTDKTTVARLVRISWEAVAGIVTRVVADSIDETRLKDLYRTGVDEVCFRRQRYLTVVADHDRGGRVVWAKEGRDAATLEAFYDQLGEEAAARLEAVSLDMGAAYAKATSAKVPQARQCIDPFHVIKLANQAIDQTRRWAWRSYERSPRFARWVKGTRWALVKDPKDLKPSQREILDLLRRQRSVLYRAYQLKEALRDLYKLKDPAMPGSASPPGWPGPPGAASPHSSSSRGPFASTARGSSRRSSSGCRTRTSKVSRRRFA